MAILDNISKPYIPAAKTNVLDTLRRLGWEPPSENSKIQKKWATYRHLASKNEGKNV
jgi:hypothetical protein